jgi:hypothetical protein
MPRAIALSGLLLPAILAAAPALAQPQEGDRYGAVAAAPGAPVYAPLRGRMLSWPGKADAAPPQPPAPSAAPVRYAPAAAYASRSYAPPRAYAAPTDSGQRYSGQAYAAPLPSAPPSAAGGVRRYAGLQAPTQGGSPADGWRPVYAVPQPALAGAPARPAALPTSLYSPPAPPAGRAALAPPPRATSAAQRYGYDPTADHAVHFYSVHRPFGLQPDPAPIPPQFFGATADLSEPPPQPQEARTASTAGGRTARAVPDTSVQ